ncbi:MAG: signal peptidase II [Pseudomonadota bacterium]
MTEKPSWFWVPGWIAFPALVGLDLWTKNLASARSPSLQVQPLIPGLLNLTLVHNSGAAFGIGHRWSNPFFIVMSIVAMGVILYLFAKLEKRERLARWALVLILAGALGNFIDRVRVGYVVDFIDVYFRSHHWWTFNLADSFITVGAILFGLDMLLKSKRKEPAA